MLYTETKDESGRVSLAVRISPEKVAEWLVDCAYQAAPVLSAAMADVWESVECQAEIKRALMAKAEYEILNTKRPSPVTKPVLISKEILKKGAPFDFEISYFVFPEYELSSYEPVVVAQGVPEVGDEEVDAFFAELLQEATPTTSKAAGSCVSKGDTVTIAMVATSEGDPYPSLTANERLYQIGEGFMPLAFDEMLEGMKVGEVAFCDLKVPLADESDKFRDVRVEVTLKEILRDDPNEVSDEWIRAQFPGIGGVEELKRGIRKQLLDSKMAQYVQIKSDQVLRKLSQRIEGTISDEMLEAQFEQTLMDMQEQLAQQGSSIEAFMKERALDESQLKLSLMMDIRAQDRQIIVLDAIARHEGITMESGDRERYIAMVMREAGADVARNICENMYEASFDEAVIRMKAQEWACGVSY